MKVLAITSALLVACSSAAAIAGPAETYTTDDALKARDAEAAASPGRWNFRYSRHGSGGWKRDAAPAPEAMPGRWGFRYSRHGSGGWKRDAAPAPEAMPYFRYSRHGSGGWKRDVTDAEQPDSDEDFIYLPKGMTPDDLAAMMKDAESAPEPVETEETKA